MSLFSMLETSILSKRASTKLNDSHVTLMLAVTIPFFVLTLLFYGLRIYSRLRPSPHLYWDDYTITLALVRLVKRSSELSLTCFKAAEIVAYSASLALAEQTEGHHTIYLQVPVISTAFKNCFITFLAASYANILVKVSIALMLLRMKTNLRWRVGLWVLITVCILAMLASTISQLLFCRPVSGFCTCDSYRITIFAQGDSLLTFKGNALSGGASSCWPADVLVKLQYAWGGQYLVLVITSKTCC